MDIRGVHHVSINVTDLDETLAFYRDVLGLPVLERPNDDISVAGAWLGCPDGRQIHLLLGKPAPNVGQHFAFQVGDVAATATDLAASGVKVSSPSTIRGVCIQAFCTDPSGNLVEFNQRLGN
ncbi:MAG: VOC family protein [Acidimicrobiales bacterium]